MKNLLALAVAVVFAAGAAGFTVAQTSTPAPAEKKADKPAEKKMPAKSASGTVKSASADGVVVAGKEKKKDVEWTFAVDAKTAIKKSGKSITAGDLKPGDSVHVRYVDTDGKAMAHSITVRSGGMAKGGEGKAANPGAAAMPGDKK